MYYLGIINKHQPTKSIPFLEEITEYIQIFSTCFCVNCCVYNHKRSTNCKKKNSNKKCCGQQ